MDPIKILCTMVVADRFLNTARQAREKIESEPTARHRSKETAALRRASMDLTRSLAQLRKP
jgi:hypothetical protein